MNKSVPMDRRHEVINFTEAEDAEAAALVHRIHCESYRSEGFVTDGAVTSQGTLSEDIDTTRGAHVTYFLALPIAETGGTGMASARLAYSPNGLLTELTAYRMSEAALSPGWKRHLDQHLRTWGPRSVMEVASLSKTDDATSMASFEVMRALAHHAMGSPFPVVWVAALVESAYRSVVANFGSSVVVRAGSTLTPFQGAAHVSESLRFVPVVIEPFQLMERVAHAAQFDPRPESRDLLRRTHLFMADGLPPGVDPHLPELQVASHGLSHE